MAQPIVLVIAPVIEKCEGIIGYEFGNKDLCFEALNNKKRSTTYLHGVYFVAHNEALAVLGRSRMEAVLCQYWWDKGGRVKPQFGMVCATQLGDLAALGRRLGFDDFISKWDPFNVDIPVGQQAPDEMVARTVIAVMGAVYLDSKENMGEVALKYVMSRLGVDKHPLLKSELAED